MFCRWREKFYPAGHARGVQSASVLPGKRYHTIDRGRGVRGAWWRSVTAPAARSARAACSRASRRRAQKVTAILLRWVAEKGGGVRVVAG